MAMNDEDSNDSTPKIVSEFGETTEWCRRQAVVNMRRDPAKLADMIATFGEERIRRDYPEVFIEAEDETQAQQQ